jgi:hypothetical protein
MGRARTPDTIRVPTLAPSSNGWSSDEEFDSFYDEKLRRISRRHWTPVRVAARAAQMLTQADATRVLDVGSGVGKFCIVGALSTTADFVGVEQRGRLVEIAQRAAIHYGARRATFVNANVEAYSFDGFNGVYLYNPFYEQISDLMVQIDGTIERSRTAYRRYVRTTVAKLAALASPVAVVTYNGLGGDMPPAYALMVVEPAADDQLELWVKT